MPQGSTVPCEHTEWDEPSSSPGQDTNLGVLVGAPSSERVWHRLCSKRAGPVLPFQKDEARLVLLPNPSPPSLLVMDLHLSFEQLVPGTHRALLGSPPSKGSLQVPPTKGSAQGPPFLPQQLLC